MNILSYLSPLGNAKIVLLISMCSVLTVSMLPASNLAYGRINASVQLYLSEESNPLFADCGLTVDGNIGEPTLGDGMTANQSANLVLTDNDTRTKIAGKAVFEISFENGTLINGPGEDVVVFETTRPEPFTMSAFDPTNNNYTSMYRVSPAPFSTNSTCPKNVNIASIDLSRFGVPENIPVPRLFVDNLGTSNSSSGADIADIVPVSNRAGINFTSFSPSQGSSLQPTDSTSEEMVNQSLQITNTPSCPWFISC